MCRLKMLWAILVTRAARPFTLALLLFSLSPTASVAASPPRSNSSPSPPGPTAKPNVIVIIADDLGYGETGMMGNHEIPTPAIDALAAAGVRCTSAYVTSSYCSPSRAGLMTGRYQSRFGYDMNPTGDRNLHPEAGLPESETTFVKRLADAGYATSLVGKWHLGTVPTKQPLRRGFDEFFGFLHEGRFYVPGPPYRGVLTMIRDRSLAPGERLREGAVIRGNYANISEPAYDANNPVLRDERVIVESDYLTDAITKQAVDFIRRYPDDPFCLIASYSAVHSPMQARVEDLESDSLRHIEDVQRRIFAGMLVALDRGVGQIVDSLRAGGLERNTLVIFLSDNGGPTAELTSSNAPLRDGKGSVYEGGLRVPMVWSMPGRLPAGRVEPRPVSSLDIAATALELAGLPADPTSDGHGLMGWLNEPEREALHQEFYWRMNGGKAAYRSSDWKVVRPGQNARIELYHLASDLAESQDLAQRHPEKRQTLWERWLAIDATMPKPIELPR